MDLLSANVNRVLTSEKLDVLRNNKIKTSLEFLQANNDKIGLLLGCNIGEIIKIKETILELNNSKPIRGSNLYKICLHNTFVLKSGIEE